MTTQGQHVIIFDGPDMCGKTHIARALSKKIGVPYFKNSFEAKHFAASDVSYFANAAKYIDTYMAAFLKATGYSAIFDRAWPSEYCYPLVFKRERNDAVLRELDRMWSAIGTKIIVPYRTSYDDIVDDVHSSITSDILARLDALYVEFCAWTSCDTLRLCVDDEDLERELNEVLEFLDL